jgi:hypothetical protein
MIHSVIFKLTHPEGSAEELDFLTAARKLISIPGVQNFKCLKQTSPKNPFQYGLSMTFSNQEAFQFYDNHPDHTKFIENHWIPNVADFLEIDYEELIS